GRQLQDSKDHLLGRLRLRDGRLRRSRFAGHDVPRALGLHLAARSTDRKRSRAGRPFQDVLIALGARLGLPGFVKEDGSPKYPDGYPDYIVNHERKPGIGPLAGFRGENGEASGKGAPNKNQLDHYVANKSFWQYELPPDEIYFKHGNRGYLEHAVKLGMIDSADQIVLHLYSEALQKFRLAAEGHGDVQPPERD